MVVSVHDRSMVFRMSGLGQANARYSSPPAHAGISLLVFENQDRHSLKWLSLV